MQIQSDNQQIYPASIDQSGRILLPVELRRPMNIDQHSQLSWVKDETGLRLTTFDEAIAEIQSYFQSVSPVDDVWTESLYAQRRHEASLETTDVSAHD